MKIVGYTLLTGPYAPDPTYRNIYHYRTQAVGMNPNVIPIVFFEDLRAPDGSYLSDFRYTPTFPANTALYPVGESDVGFTIELPTDEGFPERPQYIIANVGTLAVPYYRYAFIDGYVRTGSDKIRCTCRFDQWTEHYAELMAAEFTFSRRHQKRYVDRTAATRTKLYNGLSDPVPEGMVFGQTKKEPVLTYGAKKLTYSGDAVYVIPLWIYWRINNTELYINQGSGYPDTPSDVVMGVTNYKSAVPLLACPVGILTYRPRINEIKMGRIAHIEKSDFLSLGNKTGASRPIDVLRFSHPYISQAFLSTIPPFKIIIPYNTYLGNVDIRIDDSDYDSMQVQGDIGKTYRIGLDMVPPTGTFIGWADSGGAYPFRDGKTETTAVTVNTDSSTFDAYYEPKIEESPYENKTLSIFGATVDVSPSPAYPNISLNVLVGNTGDVIFTTGNGVEIYRLQGNTFQFGADALNDTLAQWLVTNSATYQNAKLFKQMNENITGASGFVQSAIRKDAFGMFGSGMRPIYAEYQAAMTERAMISDMKSSPGSANIQSTNGTDNIPFIDIPTITKRVIPDDVKAKIMAYWHVYGYPDNKIGTIETDATLRESFSYVQGALVNMIPGVYPGEISEIMSALRSGVWLWETRFNEPATKAVSDYEYVDRTKPMLTIQNNEVI